MGSRVAVTVKDTGGTGAEVDPRFGRAHAFLIVERDSGAVVKEIVNDAANAAHGAGTGAAAIMSENGVDAVISGRFGPKACQALGALHVEMWMAPEGVSASRALALLADGELEKMEIKRY
jgi:predicted Fe-Mo cluster-binding NifX family protein